MTAYAIGWLRDLIHGPEIIRYIEEIDATLAPYDGRFRVHGDRPHVIEGEWSGDFVLIEFPSMAAARNWYASEAYSALIPLRARNSNSVVFLIDGVDDAYRATNLLKRV